MNALSIEESTTNNCFQNLGEQAFRFEQFMYGYEFSGFRNIMDILQELPWLQIKDGYELDAYEVGSFYGSILKPYCCKVGAEEPYLPVKDKETYIPYNDSLRIKNRISWNDVDTIPSVLSYFDIPFTETGILQAWMLQNLSDFMPKMWHANYGTKYFLFDVDMFRTLFPDSVGTPNSLSGCLARGRLKVNDKIRNMELGNLLPKILIKGDSAVLTYTYWNDWRGLICESVNVLKEGNTISFSAPEQDVVIKHECDIMF